MILINKTTYAFIDASNLFYGGEKSLGWKIDYEKLFGYLRKKYNVSKALYFGGAEIHNFSHDYLKQETVRITELEKYLADLVKNKSEKLNEVDLVLIRRHLKRVRFYLKLQGFGYNLYIKPVKFYEQGDESIKKKANCDVEMAFRLMKDVDNFDRVIILSGDGDFLPVLKYLKDQNKEVLILARGPRTAKEIRQFAGSNFRDFEYLKYILQMEE